MSIPLKILHDLKPQEISKIVALSKQTDKAISLLILEAARDLAAQSLTLQDRSSLRTRKNKTDNSLARNN